MVDDDDGLNYDERIHLMYTRNVTDVPTFSFYGIHDQIVTSIISTYYT